MAFRDVALVDQPKYLTEFGGNCNNSASFSIRDDSGNNSNIGPGGDSHFSAVASLLYGDTIPAMQATSGSSTPNGNITTVHSANTVFTWEGVFQFAANPASNQALWGYGGGSAGQSISVTLRSDGKLQVDTNTTAQVVSPSALATGVPHYYAVTWDQTTLSLYIDSLSPVATATGMTFGITASTLYLFFDRSQARQFVGIQQVLAGYAVALSQARIQAHWFAAIRPYESSATLKNSVLNALLGFSNFTAETAIYAALFQTQPTDANASGTEANYSGYARVLVGVAGTNWTTPSQSGTDQPYTSSNKLLVTFPTNVGTAQWVGWMALYDSLTVGNELMWAQLTSPQNVVNGMAPIISIGNLIPKAA